MAVVATTGGADVVSVAPKLNDAGDEVFRAGAVVCKVGAIDVVEGGRLNCDAVPTLNPDVDVVVVAGVVPNENPVDCVGGWTKENPVDCEDCVWPNENPVDCVVVIWPCENPVNCGAGVWPTENPVDCAVAVWPNANPDDCVGCVIPTENPIDCTPGVWPRGNPVGCTVGVWPNENGVDCVEDICPTENPVGWTVVGSPNEKPVAWFEAVPCENALLKGATVPVAFCWKPTEKQNIKYKFHPTNSLYFCNITNIKVNFNWGQNSQLYKKIIFYHFILMFIK